MRLVAVGLCLISLSGCDLILAGVLISRSQKNSSSSSAAPAPVPDVSIAAIDATASEAGDPGVFEITRTGDTSADLIVFFTVGGTATSGVDYTSIGTQATIPTGALSVQVTVSPKDDLFTEGSETVVVTVTPDASYTVTAPGDATVTITDDDDNRYHVFVANLTAGQATTEQTTLTGNGGNPAGPTWTEVLPQGGFTQLATAEFVPPGGMNTILIQASDAQVYDIDAVEVMNAAGDVSEWANGTIYQARMSSTPPSAAANLLGTPDGKIFKTAATSGAHSVVFTRYATTISRFRVHLWAPGARTSGDVEWVATYARGGDQTAGGSAVSAAGTVYTTFHDDTTKDIWVVRHDSTGALGGLTSFATGITATLGGHGVAVDDTNSAVYVGGTVDDGNIGIEKYDLTMTDTTPSAGSFYFKTSFLGTEVTDLNAIAVDNSGAVIIAGGITNLGGNIDHWMMKVTGAVTGSAAWALAPLAPSDSTDTWYRGVAVDGSNSIFATGDLTVGGFTDIFTQRVTSGGIADWSDPLSNGGQTDLGNAIAVDRTGNVDDIVVGGFQTVTSQGKNAVLHKYTNGGSGVSPFPLSYNGTANGDDEILGVAVDSTNGAIYAVGYETVTGQGTNMWIRRYSAAGAVVWTRTHHHAGVGDPGNDRAVSVKINGNFIYVVGDVTLAGGGKDIHVRKYRK